MIKCSSCPREDCNVAPAKPLPDDPIDLARASWQGQGWEQAADGMAVVTSIMRVQQVLLARIEAILRPLGLTFARYEVLMLLRFSRRGCLPVGKIGERLQVHPASVTNAVQRLEQDGYVARTANPVDGRSVLAEVTPRGRKLTEQATAQLNSQVFSIVPIPQEDQREVYTMLKGMRRAFGDFR
jgi:DNA-binding MarR family transcriptional regulator